MNFEEILNFRRAVRNYAQDKELDIEKVVNCMKLSTLAPTSSNMQLYEFYHITDKETMKKLSAACFHQIATETAKQMVVYVIRPDLYKQRAKQVLDFEIDGVMRNSPADRRERRIKGKRNYYGKVIPFLYTRFFGIMGCIRKIIAVTTRLFKPMYTEVSEQDMRVVMHKSCGLAAQTFMLSMANEGYDTCPLEGFDSKMIKKILNLPHAAEINMLITCGIRNGESGVWGERFRVPFEEVYRKID